MSYIGFAFQPYVGPWQESGGAWAADAWSSYSQEVVQSLLGSLQAQGIDMISTYGNGYSAYGGIVSQTDSNQYILPAASALGMTVVAGANQWLDASQTSGWNLAVTKGDITSTLEFASNHPGVVIGLNITNEAIESGTSAATEPQFAENIYTLVQYAISQLGAYGFQNTDPTNSATYMPISIRESQGILCGVSQSQSYSDTLLQILKSVNLVYANIYPYGFTYNLGANPSQTDFQDYVKTQLGAYYQAIISSFEAVNLSTPVCIGETGWPTNGVNATNPALPTSIELAQWNYAAVVDWAISNQITTFAFEAFNEPFKSGLPGSPPSPPTYSGSDQAYFGVFQAQGQVPSDDYPYNQTNNYSLNGTVQQYCYSGVTAGSLLPGASG
ncbi:MAG: hypothetical protein K2Y32_01545 [Candidatus Obscuribacterales bacterium]|nr:hypothetical protein [Candidatus Obscuribacterales bacterium]